MRPVADPGNVSVLDRIEVNVIDMAGEVGIITDGVFPIAALPNSLLAPDDLAPAPLHFASKEARKSTLNLTPANRKICVALRQAPDRMKMVRQNADRDRVECTPFSNRRINFSQQINVPHQEVTRSIRERHGKEKDAALKLATTIRGHRAKLSRCADAWAKSLNDELSLTSVASDFAHPTSRERHSLARDQSS